jgi:THO complex subunit 2
VLDQRERRAMTQALYTQRKFNLLREETEGYSKLIAELASADLSDAAATGVMVERLKSIIGLF